MLPSLEVTGVEPVAEINSEGKEDNVTLTGDQLELCFTSQRAGGTGDVDVYCATRSSLDEPFGQASEASALNSPGFETSAALALDGRSIWIGSDRDGGIGGLDVWRADRTERSSPWQPPVIEASLNSTADDIPRPVGWAGRVMPMGSRRDTADYWTYFAEFGDGVFSTPELVDELAEPGRMVVDGLLSEDGRLLLYVALTDTDGQDIFYSVRETTAEAFGEPIALVGVNSPNDERDPWLSPDGTAFYFVSDRDGTFDVFRGGAILSD